MKKLIYEDDDFIVEQIEYPNATYCTFYHSDDEGESIGSIKGALTNSQSEDICLLLVRAMNYGEINMKQKIKNRIKDL